jgi:hypothetical protein
MQNNPAGKPVEQGPQDGKRKMTEEQSARLKEAARKSGKEEAADNTLSEEGAEQRIDMLKGQKPKNKS